MNNKGETLDNHSYFQELLDKAASFYKSIEADKVIRVIAHLDADGIAACSILCKLLVAEKRKFVVSIMDDLRQSFLQKLSSEHYAYYIFLDLGSANISGLEKNLPTKKILVIDHCYADKNDDRGYNLENVSSVKSDNLVHVNPYLIGIDGSKEVSSAGMVYLLCVKMNDAPEGTNAADAISQAISNNTDVTEPINLLALVGAISEHQDSGGFIGLNRILLDKAIEKNILTKTQSLTIIRDMNQPLHKMLEYCINPVLPGITGSEGETLSFLAGLGINPKHDNSWKICAHLAEGEIEKIKTALQNKFMDKSFISSLYGDNYLVTRNFASIGNNLREISAIIKACGRLNNTVLGLSICMGIGNNSSNNTISNFALLAKKCNDEYKNRLLAVLAWYAKNRDSPSLMKGNGYLIVNFTMMRDFNANLLDKAIEMVSIVGEVQTNTLVLGLAAANNKTTKVSLCYLGQDKESSPKLDKILKEIAEQVNGELIGDRHVTGALIAREKEMDFIKIARKVLESMAMEEIIR
ncbi:DHH family phosphoesterase [Candidatus Woesearchaeota archaeon]|nr:DHH family phosphoesterase [Candidatus Woesearchaeota archaeon]